MVGVFGKEGFEVFIRSFEKDGKMSPMDLRRMILESIGEVLEMVFGKQIAQVLEGSLEVDTKNNMDFDSVHFTEKLETLFGNDAKHIRMMVEGKILTNYYYHEFMKNIGLPITR
jgi:hypothetical protein